MFIDIYNDFFTFCRRPRHNKCSQNWHWQIGIKMCDDKSKLEEVYQKLRVEHINLPSQKA